MADVRDCPALRAGTVGSVADVVGRLGEIHDSTERAAAGCGIARFSRLYLTITQGIAEHLRTGGYFADDGYVARLAVVFANRYFAALRAWAAAAGGDDDGGPPPRAWALLFDTPADGEITAVQLAGAGVNAHINFDLAVATVDTARELGDTDLAIRQDDYARINDVFGENMDALLAPLLEHGSTAGGDPSGLSARGRLLTRIVTAARRFAWEDAETLWTLDRRSDEWVAKERHMDQVAWLIGRGILLDLPG